MPRDIKDLQREKLDLTVEQQKILKDLFGIDLPLQVEVFKQTNAPGKQLIVTDAIDEQEAVDATCAAWC